MIDQIMLILARLFIIDGEILRDLGDFVWCAGQTYKLRVKGAYIVFQHLRRIPLRIDGDKNWLHLGRTCRILFFEEPVSLHYFLEVEWAHVGAIAITDVEHPVFSSEERRVGKECVITCGSRW